MSPRGARAGAALVLLLSAPLGGCVYYNSIYNAERAFRDGEAHWSVGRDSLARSRYDDVVRKAAAAYRKDPSGSWADDALYLMGRARFRAGDLNGAEEALREAEARADDAEVRLGARVWLGAVAIARGDHRTGLTLLNAAMDELEPGPALAEAHLWRARVLMGGDQLGGAWWDLDRAGTVDDALRVPAALERIGWGLRHREPVRTREGVERLLSYPEGGARRDSLETLMGRAARIWGATGAAALLDSAEVAAWDRSERGRIRLVRARLLREGGDRLAADGEARAVASGIGPSAAEARLLLARWTLADARSLADVRAVVPLLLPAEADPRVEAVLGRVVRLTELADQGLDDPLGLFAAGELARDDLGAPVLARGLFLAYADGAPDAPWTPKALLAALDVSHDEADRSWIRGRLEARTSSPYVLAARGMPAPGLEELESDLERRLAELGSR